MSDWKITYEEEFPDSEGPNRIGILQDKEHPYRCLFFHLYRDEPDQPMLFILYNSILMTEDSLELRCPYTEENIYDIIIPCLNSCEDNYCGDDSPIRNLKFNYNDRTTD